MKKILLVSALLLVSCQAQEKVIEVEETFPEGWKVIDLTHEMYEDMAFWPGGVGFTKEKLVDYDQGYLLHKFSMGENTGTHLDAPAHFIKGNRYIHEIPVEDLLVRAVVIDVGSQVAENSDYTLTLEDLQAWEATHGEIPARSLVILNTGWHKKFNTPEAYINADEEGVMHFPGFSAPSVEFLLKRQVIGIGIDTLSLDFGGSEDFIVHQVMLGKNKYQIENLANLDALPPTGAVVFIGVLPVREGSQAQARIIGLVKEDK